MIPKIFHISLYSDNLISASKEKSDFPIQKLWVLPSHLVVLHGRQKEELLAYDQVPKLGPINGSETKLLSDGMYRNVTSHIFF